ncbi:uncharacterized protein BKCO1_21000149 [Diplodia corticola]|uniref:Ubiquitin smt3 n=1 Tax=Diplodia corticola TaxID=236234 RepID=A0A1J9S2H8_9PEZI|nr:uncharacterized protein BKCO1_21000149 [Diplodia corticola]OJD34775.1 hypothetical protein BKCO1_21000149 [Diplodia corticola]
MSSAISSGELEASLNNLKISTSSSEQSPSVSPAPGATKPSKKPANKVVAESWEDAASDSEGSGTETELDGSATSPVSVLNKHAAAEGPLAPPPTPASPQFDGGHASTIDARFAAAQQRQQQQRAAAATMPTPSSDGPARRPEKTTSAASRMIAAGLGMRAPKRTDEEREYDRVMREKERKRREKEREEAANAKNREEEAKKAIWDD